MLSVDEKKKLSGSAAYRLIRLYFEIRSGYHPSEHGKLARFSGINLCCSVEVSPHFICGMRWCGQKSNLLQDFIVDTCQKRTTIQLLYLINTKFYSPITKLLLSKYSPGFMKHWNRSSTQHMNVSLRLILVLLLSTDSVGFFEITVSAIFFLTLLTGWNIADVLYWYFRNHRISLKLILGKWRRERLRNRAYVRFPPVLKSSVEITTHRGLERGWQPQKITLELSSILQFEFSIKVFSQINKNPAQLYDFPIQIQTIQPNLPNS